MTAEEKEIGTALNTCTYLPGSYEKRFARTMAAMAENKPDMELTERQRAWLYKQLHRYRRQIPGTHRKYSDKIKI